MELRKDENRALRSSPTAPRTHGTDKLISQLFVRLTSIYGPRWTGRYIDDQALAAAKREWQAALISKSSEALAQGLRTCINFYLEWPPTLGQFKAACKEPHMDLPPSTTPRTPERKEFVDVKREIDAVIRAYRAEHPGTTIADACLAYAKRKKLELPFDAEAANREAAAEREAIQLE